LLAQHPSPPGTGCRRGSSRFLQEDLLDERRKRYLQRQAATLTMSLKPGFSWDPQAAKQTAALLPEEGFTAVHDREQVTHLMLNGGAFVLTGFVEVWAKPDQELHSLVLGKLYLDHKEGPTLNLKQQNLLP